ncbi:MAG: hypothetical protein IJ535_12440 [Pseudobutyrivibrio sp.]|uniref:hypothetical protein n=1 Tax=Pseudobutyrivibrio sp. TaxID=2014367 RepID=UPI0025E7AD9C|nr:hypothetical protein [Pseudobutyrivibrio sp.]MBQ8490581.1 hypothetical protein [Pseudobutyrivibrio sp.]
MRNDDGINYNEYIEKRIFREGKIDYIEYLLNDTQQGVKVLEGNAYVWAQILSKYNTKEQLMIKKEWTRFREENKLVVIYGAGKRCISTINWLKTFGVSIDGIAVSSMKDNPEEIDRIPVKMYSLYPYDVAIIISIASKIEAKMVYKLLDSRGYKNISYINEQNMKRITEEE